MIVSFYTTDGSFYKILESQDISWILDQLQEGDLFVGGRYSKSTHYVDSDNNIKEYTEEEKDYVLNAPFGYAYNGRKKQYVQTRPDSEIRSYKESEVRAIRNKLLESSDHMLSVADYPLTEEEKTELIEYRQYLRDITTDTNFPDGVDFRPPTTFQKFTDTGVCESFLQEYSAATSRLKKEHLFKQKSA